MGIEIGEWMITDMQYYCEGVMLVSCSWRAWCVREDEKGLNPGFRPNIYYIFIY